MRKKILVKGPLLSMSGYGVQARFALNALKSREDILDIYALNIPWGATGFVVENTPEKRWLDFLFNKTIMHIKSGGTFDASLQVTIPGEFEKIAPYNIGYTAGAETNIVSGEWIQKINLMDKVITTSEHTKAGILNSVYEVANKETGERVGEVKAETPVEAVNYPVREIEPEEIDLDLPTAFNFLVVAQWCPRKNLESTIAWFVEEFKDSQDVGLVLKINQVKNSLMDKDYTRQRLQALLSSLGERKCSVYLVHGAMSDGEMTSLYRHKQIKGLISLSHGEGFGLPVFEAAYNGLPIIAPSWSGHVDFLYAPVKTKMKPHFTVVHHQIQQIQPEAIYPGILLPESQWCYPQKNSYRKALRQFLSNWGGAKRKATTLRDYILKNWSQEEINKEFVAATEIEELDQKVEQEVLVFD